MRESSLLRVSLDQFSLDFSIDLRLSSKGSTVVTSCIISIISMRYIFPVIEYIQRQRTPMVPQRSSHSRENTPVPDLAHNLGTILVWHDPCIILDFSGCHKSFTLSPQFRHNRGVSVTTRGAFPLTALLKTCNLWRLTDD